VFEDREGHKHFSDKPLNKHYRPLQIQLTYMPTPTSSEFLARKRKYKELIDAIALQEGLDSKLVHAVVRVESAYNPRALSSKGAMCLMQLMPDTAKDYGVYDPWYPASNLRGGAQYLRDLLVQFEGNLRLALAAYNAGPNAVLRYGKQIPPFKETQDYEAKVTQLLSQN
jgi:soluble lytic murein transglycosylase-like protein